MINGYITSGSYDKLIVCRKQRKNLRKALKEIINGFEKAYPDKQFDRTINAIKECLRDN